MVSAVGADSPSAKCRLGMCIENVEQEKPKTHASGRDHPRGHSPGLGVSLGEFAEMLGVSRRTVVELVAERRSISSDVAIRLVLGTTPESWLSMQIAVDLWDERRITGS